MGQRVIAGLDVGTTKVCAILGEYDGSHLRVIGVGSVPSRGLRKGMVVDVESTIQGIAEAISKAEQMAGVTVDHVYAGISGAHLTALNSSGVIAISRADREIVRADVDRVVKAARTLAIPPDREILHVLPREFVIDGVKGIQDPVGMTGTRLEAEVHVITGAATAISNLTKCVGRAGLELEDLIVQPLASSEAVLDPDEKELGVALVDIGGGTTDVAVYHEGSLCHTAVLPVGGNHITHDIAVGLRTSVATAEKLKLAHGSALLDIDQGSRSIRYEQAGHTSWQEVALEDFIGIIEPRVDEILRMVERELQRSGLAELIPAGVVLSGGCSLLAGIVDAARDRLALPARTGIPQGIGGLVDVVNSPMYATGVGLIQYGLIQTGPLKGAEETAATHDEGLTMHGRMSGSERASKAWGRVRTWFEEFFGLDGVEK